MEYTVYKHTAPNGKVYIGITSVEPKRRWQSGWGYRTQLFYRAIQKYGWENIEHEVLYSGLSKEEAEQKEIELITAYKSNQKEYGYNVDNGGYSAGKLSDATREKLKKSHTGIKYTQETREKHRAAQLRLWNDEEYRRSRTYEYKKRKAQGGYSVYKPGKPVVCVETRQIFARIKDASESMGICDECIRKCCNGLRKTAGGFRWEFVQEVAHD